MDVQKMGVLRSGASLGLAMAMIIGATGCDEETSSEDSVIEMFSWWTAPGEAEALAALLEVHSEEHPDVEVINAAASNSANARERLEQRFAQGFPPDTFQANGGFDLSRWITTNGQDASQSKIEELDWFYEERGLYDVIPPAVIEAVSYGGAPYSVPLNIHRNNSLFYNSAILEEHGLTVPASIDELLATCQTLSDAGVTCLALGGRDDWALALLLWENVMISSLGATYHRDFFAGRRSPDDPELVELVDDFLSIWAYADTAAFDTTWSDAVAKVGNGQAAFTVMGDWAKGMLQTQGLTPGVDFGQVAFPGSAGTFVFATDTFPLALGGRARDATIDLLDVVASPEGQVAFNVVKGSIPARTDAPADRFDVLGQRMIADFRAAEYYSLAGIAPAEFAVNPLISETLRTGDAELLLNGIRNYYDVLRERGGVEN